MSAQTSRGELKSVSEYGLDEAEGLESLEALHCLQRSSPQRVHNHDIVILLQKQLDQVASKKAGPLIDAD